MLSLLSVLEENDDLSVMGATWGFKYFARYFKTALLKYIFTMQLNTDTGKFRAQTAKLHDFSAL